jgi:type IV pilus assembly protein PilY1
MNKFVINSASRIFITMTVAFLLLFISIGFAGKPGGGGGGEPSMAEYCCYPPFVVDVVTPNIILALDNSGSMNWAAYTDTIMMIPADTIPWYGYFNPDSNYNSTPQGFESSPTGTWPGHLLNWACMSRADVLKKVLVGGEATASGTKLNSEGQNTWRKYYAIDGSNYNKFTVTHTISDKTEITITKVGTAPINATLSKTIVIVEIPEIMHNGVLDWIGDKDDDDHWDDDAPRFGVWLFNSSSEGGHCDDYLGEPEIVDLRQTIDNLSFVTWTQLAESYFQLLHYVSQARAYPPYGTPNYTVQPKGVKDPYYDKWLKEMVECRRTFVLLVTDGMSTMDTLIPDSDGSMPNCTGLKNYYDGKFPLASSYGTDYLDDVALYGHVNDLRPDSGTGWGTRELNDMQEVTLYVVYAFGDDDTAKFLLRESAMCGGFDDANGNDLPDLQAEWDEDGDSIPDNYYEAQNGSDLEDAIMTAIAEMLESISSASGVGVVSLGTKAGGATSQAQFYPRKTVGKTELSWIGQCQTLWLDQWGWIREDTQDDAVLHLVNDYILDMEYDEKKADVMVTRIKDKRGQGNPAFFDTLPTPISIQDLTPIWNAGDVLYNTGPADRNIGTFLDFDKDGFIDATELRLFIPSLAGLFLPYLGVEDTAQAETLINWIRGIDYPSKRNRTIAGKVWKLGDIINSGPVTLQKPIERYDFIYGDVGYGQYFDMYEDRMHVVVVGANDGMMHAFYCGKPVFTDSLPLTPMHYDSLSWKLGEEWWGWIPYNLLPHLQWLADPNYCHVYYVDLKPYVTDVQIFPDEVKHPNGWGAVLINGMRLGGMPIVTEADTFGSSFFAIDVTNPYYNQITPMWEYTDDDIGLSLCYHTAVKIDSGWYYVFGSGPETCSGESSQQARIFILDLKTGQLLRKIILPDSNAFVSNIFSTDWGLNYDVDRIYFGTCYEDSSNPTGWGGKIYRIETHEDMDVMNWDTTMVFDMERPITGEGSIATDEYNHLWLYFGSGRFFSDVDEADANWYRYVGFRDDTTHATTVSGLFNVTNVWIDTLGEVHGVSGLTEFQDLIDTIDTHRGWWRNLGEAGERNVTTSLVFGEAVLFTSFVPTGDICSYGVEGYLWAVYYRTGTAIFAGFSRSNETFLTPVGSRVPERIELGPGMPSEPSLYVSPDETKVYIQAGGAILNPQTGLPGLAETGVIMWRGR